MLKHLVLALFPCYAMRTAQSVMCVERGAIHGVQVCLQYMRDKEEAVNLHSRTTPFFLVREQLCCTTYISLYMGRVSGVCIGRGDGRAVLSLTYMGRVYLPA
jgi:hypothetical protein